MCQPILTISEQQQSQSEAAQRRQPVKLQLNKNCMKKGGITSVIPPLKAPAKLKTF